jgi:hypothetical protein
MDESQAKPYNDPEYQILKTEALVLLHRARQFPAWRFKHAAKERGERKLGQWMWTIYLEAHLADK